jgi:hypothetical protein
VGERVRNRIKTWLQEFWTWIKSKFQYALERVEELAEEIARKANDLGVSVSHILPQMHRRLVSFVIKSSVIPPFSVGEKPNDVILKPSKLTLSFGLKTAPSLASLDAAGIVRFLTGLLDTTLNLNVEYTARSSIARSIGFLSTQKLLGKRSIHH